MTTMPDGVAAQHSHLSGSIAQIQRNLEAGANWEQLASDFDCVIDQFELHFSHEEELMELGDYPAAAGHKQEHAAFLMRVRALRAQCNAFQSELLAALTETLLVWLRRHERTSDRVAARYLGIDDW